MKNLITMLQALADCSPEPQVKQAYEVAANLASRFHEEGPAFAIRIVKCHEYRYRSTWYLLDQKSGKETQVNVEFAKHLELCYGVPVIEETEGAKS